MADEVLCVGNVCLYQQDNDLLFTTLHQICIYLFGDVNLENQGSRMLLFGKKTVTISYSDTFGMNFDLYDTILGDIIRMCLSLTNVYHKGLATMSTVKRSASVASDGNLRNPLHAGDEACKWQIHPSFQTQSRCHQES